tara:strand:- start:867 stop:1316 length:450 start_codon:yes stop_codon:yes gene_type:complete
MFEGHKLEDYFCDPILVFCGTEANLNLTTSTMKAFHKFNFNSYESTFNYEIKIASFDSFLFTGISENLDDPAFLVEISIISDFFKEDKFFDANVFLQKDLDDLIEYCIMLPRMFKGHHRYLLDMEKYKSCKYGDFNKKVSSWKREVGIS